MSIHVLVTPMEKVSERPDGEPRWCFVCRKQRAFTREVWQTIDRMSYYGPDVKVVCENGHADGDLFPGRWREWID